MSKYGQLPPNVSLETSEFRWKASDDDLQALQNLVRCSKLGPKTYENSQPDGKYGATYEWMKEAKAYWENNFDWRAVENRLQSFPNLKAQIVDDDGSSHGVHFLALFSQKEDAIPLMCIHGWPGSILEFLGLLSLLQDKYNTPDQLPYHIIVPSLPGFAFSDPPPLDKDWTLNDSARLLHKLMVGLGFGGGYAVQGGDIGSYAARMMASSYDACKAMHLNMCVITCPDESTHGSLSIEDNEREGLERAVDFGRFGTAYAVEQSTKPATIGFTLSASPLAMLAWIGEKFRDWTDTTPSLDEILASVTLYWLTDSFPTGIYSYRQEIADKPGQAKTQDDLKNVFRKRAKGYMFHQDLELYCHKPMGFSWFPYELGPVPKSWISTTGELVWFRYHDKGGHFAALEQPELLLEDVEDFLKQVWV